MATRIVLGLAIALGCVGSAAAQSGQAGVFCINGRVDVAYGSLAQVASGRGNGTNCVIGPSFIDRGRGIDWVRKNLGVGEGGPCSCN